MDYMQGIHDLLSRISSADIIVIGGSYAGLMATYEASRKGFKTILIEEEPCISPYIYYSGIWGYVVISKNLHDLLIKDLGLRMIKKVDEVYLVDSNEFYTKILAKIYDLGGYVLTGFFIEPYYNVDEEGNLELVGVLIRRSDENRMSNYMAIKARYIIDSSGLDASFSQYIIERIKPPIIPAGPGPIIPGSNEVFERTYWLVEENIVTAGLAAASIFGAAIPYPDVTPLILSGKRAIELIIESMEKVSERRTHEDKYIPGII